MANTSILTAFERMWHHVVAALSNKSDISHAHDDKYYTQTQIDTKLQSKAEASHNHDDKYDVKGASSTAANTALESAKSYTDTKVSNLVSSTTVDNKISTHNTSTSAHSDIRDLITGLTTRLNTLANSDDTTLDQMSEVVAYIKNNKSLIDGITTSKVNVADIVNDLTTNVSNKPLSAAQGVALKALIDAIVVPTKVSELTNDKGYLTSYTETDPTVPAWAKAASKPTYTASEVGALPNTTTIPKALSELTADSTHRTVTDTEKSTWSGKANTSDIPTKVSQLTNDKNYLTAVPSEYVTETELAAKGYLTQHQSLENYATKEYVDAQIRAYVNEAILGGAW